MSKLIKHRDVTGVLLQFSQEQIESLMEAMPPEQRRFARVVAKTITEPHEIWQAWVADERDKGRWRNVRSYLQLLDLSDAGMGAPFGAAIIQFAYGTCWELANVRLAFGQKDEVVSKLDAVRQGSIAYSIHQN